MKLLRWFYPHIPAIRPRWTPEAHEQEWATLPLKEPVKSAMKDDSTIEFENDLRYLRDLRESIVDHLHYSGHLLYVESDMAVWDQVVEDLANGAAA